MASTPKWRRREWEVPVADGPLAGEVQAVTVRSLTTRQVAKAQARLITEARDALGEQCDAVLDRMAAGKAATNEPGAASERKAREPKDDVDLCGKHGFSALALVEYGLVAIDGERLPAGDAERRDWADELPAAVAGYLARVVAVGVGVDADTNALWDADAARPTASAASSPGR